MSVRQDGVDWRPESLNLGLQHSGPWSVTIKDDDLIFLEFILEIVPGCHREALKALTNLSLIGLATDNFTW